MEVLVTCLNYPYPLENGENLRIFHYVRTLRDRHTFDLVCLGDYPPPDPIRSLFRRIIPVKASRVAEPTRGLKRIWAAFSLEHFSPPIPALREALDHAIRNGSYDLVWTSADIFPSLPSGHGLPLLGDIVDDLVVQYGTTLKATRAGLPYLRVLKRKWQAEAFEKHYFSQADACLYVSEKDASVFSRICPGIPVHVIHNGVDADFFRPSDAQVDEDVVVFEGSMDFFPNIDGAAFLCREVLPHIQARRPNAKVLLVGKNPSRTVQGLASPSVTVTGFVDDVRPYLANAAVFVSPTRVGAGIKNKILQAWAMGKAVVATPISTGGLRCTDGDNIVVREGAEEIARAVVDLMQQPDRRRELGRRGRETIMAHYTWEAKARELELLMKQVCGARIRETADA